jgi:hypothetical protein
MGLTESTKKTYLSIAIGKIRKKSDDKDDKAVMRELKDKSKVYERVYQNISGKLDSIVMREHEEYGKSWVLTIVDGDDTFAVQVSEDSRYGNDLLKKIPNLHKGSIYKFTPYDFERNGKHKVGLAIEDRSGKKIESYYQKFTGNDQEGWKVENLNGFPEFTGDKNDKDDLKIYFTTVTKFLRLNAQKALQLSFLEPAPPVETPPVDEQAPFPKDDDLPF